MATLTIRQLDDGVYERLKARARDNHRSVEAEVRNMIEERVRSHSKLVAELRAFNERMGRETGMLSDSTELIRQMRDEE